MLPWPQHLIITMSLMATVSYLHWLWLLFYFTTLVKSPGAIKHLLTQSLYAHFTWLHCFHKVYSFSKLSRRVKYIKLTVKRFGWQQTKLPWLHTVTSSTFSQWRCFLDVLNVSIIGLHSSCSHFLPADMCGSAEWRSASLKMVSSDFIFVTVNQLCKRKREQHEFLSLPSQPYISH